MGAFRSLRRNRLAGVSYYLLPLMATGFLLRCALVCRSWSELPHDVTLATAMLVGFLADAVYASYFLIPLIVYLTLIPQRLFRHPLHRVLTMLMLASAVWLILLNAAAEWIFWDEFGVRFNFIAVDYLVYTTEVVDNILESYPVYPTAAALAVLALLAALAIARLPGYRRWLACSTPVAARFKAAASMLLLPIMASVTLDAHNLPRFDNRFLQEISRNGQYSFFAAFRDNELDFHGFYLDEPPDVAEHRIRPLIAQGDARFSPLAAVPERRWISHPGEELRHNVIQIVVESLSAEFLGAFGNTEGLTPRLDALAEDSLLFTNFTATGTRTVRGMESLTLSVPPTPGRSIVKRPANEVLFSTGTILRSKGYAPAFFYGGYGYFDNMNDFFEGNGFAIHDRATESDDQILFSNAWGVSDEDLFRWVLNDADRRHESRQPFFDFVMTTSNHRPYTYPEGRIDIPSHSGRAGAVKYTDHAIGRFFDAARGRPWFDDTIFVIVADHCAGSAGKTTLPVKNYRIPLMIYAPGLLEPGAVHTLSGQIDLAPTLFGLLNWSYESEFFGRDILRMQPDDGRALIGTYQNVGLLDHGSRLTVLTPGKAAEAYDYDPVVNDQWRTTVSEAALIDTITYYQRAADLFHLKSRGTT